MNLLSDAAQSETWPAIKPQIVKGKVRYNQCLTRPREKMGPGWKWVRN